MKIGTREIGPSAPVFIIAECGSNHGGSLDAALALIDAAAKAGADAAKFQRFRVDSFLVPRPNPEALRRYELPDEWLPRLRARCDERGIEFLCTAFDFASLDVVDPFVNAHKIGSWEAPERRFVLRVAEKLKPVISSFGKAPAGRSAWKYSDIKLICRSAYPADVQGYLSRIPHLPWGVSDHTLDPITVPAAAVALGACVVEKHFRLGQPDTINMAAYSQGNPTPPPDWPVSICPADFAAMVCAIRATESAARG